MKIKFKSLVCAALAATMSCTTLSFAYTATAFAAEEGIESFSEAETVNVIEYMGDMEVAYAKWEAVTGADSYNVYVKDFTGTYNKINSNLIRQYPGYYRVDAVGLPAGNYSLKIVPVIAGVEDESKMSETPSMQVVAHDRSGFAFSPKSTYKTGSGGYNDDGSVPSNAQILYITDNTKDTVTLDVIVDSKGKKQTATGMAEILKLRQKGYDKTPLIFRLIGRVSPPAGINSSGYLEVKGCYNVTLEGIGDDATVWEWGILVREAKNAEIRNLGVMRFPDDGISLDTKNENIWVHNNDIFYGKPGSDKDQVKGDGSADVKAKSTYVTVAYNHFWDSGKCSLCGMGDSEEFFVTYHHNWFDHSDSRHPRIRVGTIHIYNNYFDGNSKYGVGATTGSSAFVENNYFRNCKYPMLISMQGSDCYNTTSGTYDYTNMPTFSKESGGMIKAYNNYMTGQHRFVDQNTTTDTKNNQLQVDAYTVSSRDEKVPDTFKTVQGGTPYNNFDTAADMYKYTPDTPEKAKENVEKYAGRIGGGDFKWTFTAEDDKSYDVNTALKSKIEAYTPSVILSSGGNSDDTEVTEVPTESTSETSTEVPTDSDNTTESTTEESTEQTTEGSGNDDVAPITPNSLGDVNGDGYITIADAAIIKQYLMNDTKLKLTDAEKKAADVNGDGKITDDDAAEIIVYVKTGVSNYIK